MLLRIRDRLFYNDPGTVSRVKYAHCSRRATFFFYVGERIVCVRENEGGTGTCGWGKLIMASESINVLSINICLCVRVYCEFRSESAIVSQWVSRTKLFI